MILFYYKSVLYILLLIIIILVAVLFSNSKNKSNTIESFQDLTESEITKIQELLVGGNPELSAKLLGQTVDKSIIDAIKDLIDYDECNKSNSEQDCKLDPGCDYNKDHDPKCVSNNTNRAKLVKLIQRVNEKYKVLDKLAEAKFFQHKTLDRDLNLKCNIMTEKQCNEDINCKYNRLGKICIPNTGKRLDRENILISKYYRDKYRLSKKKLSIMPYLALHKLTEKKYFGSGFQIGSNIGDQPNLYYISIDNQYLKFIGSTIFKLCDIDEENVCTNFTDEDSNNNYGYMLNGDKFKESCKDINKQCEDDSGFLFSLIEVTSPDIYKNYYIGKDKDYTSLYKEETMPSTYPFYLLAPFNYPKQFVSLTIDEISLKKKINIDYPKTYSIRDKQRFLLSDNRPLRHNDYNLLNNFEDYLSQCDNKKQCL